MDQNKEQEEQYKKEEGQMDQNKREEEQYKKEEGQMDQNKEQEEQYRKEENKMKELEDDKRKNIIYFLKKDLNKVCCDIGWNKDLNWNDRQRKLMYGEMKEALEKLEEQVNEIELMMMQEKELKDIEEQLKENPVSDIIVEPVEKGKISIINVKTKQVIATDTPEVIKCSLKLMSSIQAKPENET